MILVEDGFRRGYRNWNGTPELFWGMGDAAALRRHQEARKPMCGPIPAFLLQRPSSSVLSSSSIAMSHASAILPSLFLLLLTIAISHVSATPPLSVDYSFCRPLAYRNGSTFSHNLRLAFSTLSNFSSSYLYHNYSSPPSPNSSAPSPNQIFAAYQCRGDLTLSDCSQCIAQIVKLEPSTCPNAMGSFLQLDGCFMRYENFYFFSLQYANGSVVTCDTFNSSDPTFLKNKNISMQAVQKIAVQSSNGYGAVSIGTTAANSVYVVAQCIGFLSKADCKQCFALATNETSTCQYDSLGAAFYIAGGCYIRYETDLFFNTSTAPFTNLTAVPPPPRLFLPGQKAKSSSKRTDIMAVTISIAGALFLAACITLFLWRRRRQENRVKQENFDGMTEVFLLSELRKATNSFHQDNKLGEGGFGPVYKGTLTDGREVAIKKLASLSHQGLDQFVTEIKLIKGVQHRNLIQLYGYCIDGSERLLVYEYLPRNSVDNMMFDSMDGPSLDWDARQKIILGTARGLEYLHEESEECIIHRDIKLSNILLDDKLNPKISDFGMARIFPSHETHITTRFVGTLGYLAPEYVMQGHLTKKADVFSFGVVTLEILSGRRNNCLEQQPLLRWAWGLYQEGRHSEILDPKLVDKSICQDALKVIHVALLCCQEAPNLRPSMSNIIMMLVGESHIYEVPAAPPFINLNNAYVD